MWEPSADVPLKRTLRATIQAARTRQPYFSGTVVDLAEERFRRFDPDAGDLKDKQDLVDQFDQELQEQLASGADDKVIFDSLWQITTEAVQTARRTG